MEQFSGRNIFLFWEGYEYKLIKILRKLIYLHSKNGENYKVHLITHSNLKQYLDNIPNNFYKIGYSHQADFIRVMVICKYGGIWIDSDTIILNNLNSLFEIIENKNGFFIKENNKNICNGIFGSRANTPLMVEWTKKVIDKVNNHEKKKIKGGSMGGAYLRSLYDNFKNLYDDYVIFNGLDNLYPINWDKCVDEFLLKDYENFNKIIRQFQPLVILVNSVYKHPILEEKTEEQILSSKFPLNYFLSKSFENVEY